MKRTRSSMLLAGAAAVALTPVLGALGTSPALAKPDFKMPFKCHFTATAATYGDHSPQLAVDFQKAGITGTPVLASAPGTVTRVENEGDTSYGRWIEITHPGGYTTRYAHLSKQLVHEGQKVGTQTVIGKAGATGGVSGPHLHFEERKNGDPIHVVLSGRKVPYYGHTQFTSKNCGGGSTNPYTPKEVCGQGYSVIDSHRLGRAGTVYLLYNADNKKNCVTTLKHTKLGKDTATAAHLQVKGHHRATDKGRFGYYAGPVKRTAASTCVKWGGSAGGHDYTSGYEHCG